MAVRSPAPVDSTGDACETWLKTSVKSSEPKCGDQQEHAEQESEVANAVDDEGFLAGVGGGVLLEVEADEQVGGEADALPADEHQQVVVGQHQHQHEEHEQVQVGEEAPVAVVVAPCSRRSRCG